MAALLVEKCCCLPPSLSSLPSIAPPPPLSQLTHPRTHSLPMHEPPSSFFCSPFSPFHLSFLSSSSPACRFQPFFPSLSTSPPALSFSAKRLAGVFSTVVTFKTECHHCLSCSPSSLPLTCLSPCPLLLFLFWACLPLPPILLLQRGPSGPSAVPRREPGINTALKYVCVCVCVGCTCFLRVLEETACQVYISDPFVFSLCNLALTSSIVPHILFFPSSSCNHHAARGTNKQFLNPRTFQLK